MRRVLLISVASMALVGCDFAPDMLKPDVAVPTAFKEQPADAAIPTVEPASDGKWKRFDEQAKIEEFAWWHMFGDDTLDALMEQAMHDNPTLEMALNRVEAARAAAGIKAADEYPSVEVGAGPERTKQSAGAQSPNLPPGVKPNVKPYTLYGVRGTITYELDLFGRKRNQTKEAEHNAEAEQNNYRAARLSLQAELAQTYYQLLSLRAQETLLSTIVTTRQDFLTLTDSKVKAGASDDLVLSAARSDLSSAKAEYESVRDARAKAEHALALLIGIPPSELKVDEASLDKEPPKVPVGLPSELLERRPDIHAAEEGMAAANAAIGVARTGYFPDISLSLSGGYTSGELSELFNWSNHSWMVGPLAGTMLSQPIFEGGAIAAAKAQADANYSAAVNKYKAAVLQAFGEVEDQLSSVQAADERLKAAESALDSAKRVDEVAQERFKAGYSSQLERLDAERSNMAAARNKTAARADQYIATIQLIRALGGSWESPTTIGQETLPSVSQQTAHEEPREKPQNSHAEKSVEAVMPPVVENESKPADQDIATSDGSTSEKAKNAAGDAAKKPAAIPNVKLSDPAHGLDGVRVVPEDSAF